MSIRFLLFIVFVIAFSLAACYSTIRSIDSGSIFACLHQWLFGGYCRFTVIKGVYSAGPERHFWIGSSIAICVLFIGLQNHAFDVSHLPNLIRSVIFPNADMVADGDNVRVGPFLIEGILNYTLVFLASIVSGMYAKWLHSIRAKTSD